MNKSQAGFVALKLDFLEQQIGQLRQTLDEYASLVLKDGRTWLKNGGENRQSFQEMNQKIDDAILFVGEKIAEISGVAGIRAPSPSPLEGQASVMAMNPTQDSDILSSLLARMDALEVAVSNFQATTQAVLADSSDAHLEIKSELAKHSEDIMETNKRLEAQAEEAKESLNRVSDMENGLKKIEEEQSEMSVRVEKKLSTFETEESRVAAIETQLQDIATAQAKMEEQLEAKVTGIEQQLGMAHDITADVTMEIGVLTQKLKTLESSTSDLSSAVEKNTSLLEKLNSNDDKNLDALREFEERLAVVSHRGKTGVKKLSKQFADCDAKFKAVCHMVAQRVLPLERLRDIFNRCKARVDDRETVMSKYNDVLSEISKLTKKVSDLESASASPAIGFTVTLSSWPHVPSDTIISSYTDVTCNEGNHFNPSTGRFTAPQDGLYLTSVLLVQDGDGQADVSVYHKMANPGTGSTSDNLVCGVSTCTAFTRACSVGGVKMRAGDELYVQAKNVTEGLCLGSRFTCVLIK